MWEWTASLYQPYPCRPGDGRDAPEVEGRRVVRGGSWNNDRGSARAAFRDGDLPADFDYDLGFRMVLSLAPSES